LIQRKELNGDDGADENHDGAGNAGQPAATRQDDCQARRADDEREDMHCRQVPDDADKLVHRGLTTAWHAQQLGQLADNNHQRQAVHESDDDRLGQQVGHEPESQERAQDADRTDED
jgi:hypothetical protein